MRDFKELEQMLADLKQIARGGQKVVYSAIHPIFGNVVVKLFF
jgi:hypothetical protein